MSTIDQGARLRRLVITTAVCGLLLGAVPVAAITAPSAATVLDLPYGEATGQVGFLPAGALDPSSHPLGPAHFQMTEDGSIWVLDTVNARILEFRGGEQVSSISADVFQRFPDLFGVTRSAVFLAKQGRRDDMPAGFLWRYDRAEQTSRVIDLDLPDGRRFLPMRTLPLGSSGSGLLICGSTYPNLKDAAIAIDEKGSISSVSEGDCGATPYMAAADGTVWRVILDGEQLEAATPVVAQRWSASERRWTSAFSALLPRRPELSSQRQNARIVSLGVDARDRIAVALFEGKNPGSVRFLRLSTSGELLAAITMEELGKQPSPVYDFFPSEAFQLLSDGSILTRYATADRYCILQITF